MRIRSKIIGSGLAAALTFLFIAPVLAQETGPVVVQPGAPGQPTRKLPSDTSAVLPPLSQKNVEFMQGMIIHHAQAVDMVALMKARTDNKALLLLGSRISQSQSAEIGFMKRWLVSRGQKVSAMMGGMDGMDMKDHDMSGHHMMMPGMLTPKQMEELADSKGAEFDRLFLEGMIQHHAGALIMVAELFETAGAGQDAELFNFATDVDSGQRAEIRIMKNMLKEMAQDKK